MVTEKEKIISSAKPFEIREKIFETFKTKTWRDKISEYIERIKQNNYRIVDFRMKLTDFEDLTITDLFLKNIDEFYQYLQEALSDSIFYNKEIKDNLKLFTKEQFHIIIDLEDNPFENRILKDFSQDLTPFLNRYCIFHGRFLDLKLNKITQYLELEYQCSVCGSHITLENNIRCEKDMIPKSCSSNRGGKTCKNTKFDASEIVSKKTVEHGLFKLGDPSLDNFKYTLPCKIFRNIDYFIKKVEHLGINEDVKVIGILRTDETDLFTERRKLKHRYRKYIEVIDIVSERTHKIDEYIITKLKEKMNQKPFYREILIDAIFPHTFEIDVFFRQKLTICASYVSGGHWNTNFRQTINAIIGGGGSTFKSSTSRIFCKMIDDRNVLFFENRKITRAGLYGTTKRNVETGDVEIIFGVLSLYSDGLIIFDEAQELEYEILADLRCVEKGDVGGIQDALNFSAPAKESLLLVQNFVKRKDGFFESNSDIIDNLGWKKENAQSLLERFDLFCNIPKPDKYIQKSISMNERKEDNDNLGKEIAELLELDDFIYPRFITSYSQKLQYIIKNWLWKAKTLYRECQISEEFKNRIRTVYDEILEKGYESFRDEFDINQRAKNSCYKLLSALASMRLDNEVKEPDYELFRIKCMNLITAFQDSRIFNPTKLNANEIFMKSFNDLSKKKVFYQISIKEHIEFMRAYIKRVYYPNIDFITNPEELELSKNEKEERKKQIRDTEKQIDEVVNEKTSLSDNYKYRVLLKNNEVKINELGYFRHVIDNKTYLMKDLEEDIFTRKDADIVKALLDKIFEIYENNDKKIMIIKNLVPILSIIFSELDKETIEDYIKLLMMKDQLIDIVRGENE